MSKAMSKGGGRMALRITPRVISTFFYSLPFTITHYRMSKSRYSARNE